MILLPVDSLSDLQQNRQTIALNIMDKGDHKNKVEDNFTAWKSYGNINGYVLHLDVLFIGTA